MNVVNTTRNRKEQGINVRHKRFGDVLLPDFMLVGAAKSATTSLHYYLDQHPAIRMPSVKEPWFFSFVDNPPQFTSPSKMSEVVYSLDEYTKLFDGARSEQLLGDASPSYLYTYRDSIRNIRSIYPEECLEKLRIVISLRDPVSRAFSQYWTFKRELQEPLGFEEAADERTIAERLNGNWNIFYDYIGFGRYYEQVKAYIDAFGNDRVLVLLYDDIETDPVGAIQSIYAFLGVDSRFVPNVQVKHNSISGEPMMKWFVRFIKGGNPLKRAVAACLPKKLKSAIVGLLARGLLRRSDMAEPVRRQLIQAFADDVERLENLIGRDLTHWKSSV